MITSSEPVTLQFEGQSFFGRHSLTSTASIRYDAARNAIQIIEGGTTECLPETDRSRQVGPIMYQGMSTVLAASENIATQHRFNRGEHGEMQYEFEVPCSSQPLVLVWAMHDDGHRALQNAMAILRKPRESMIARTQQVNRELNTEIPWFRCSDKKFEDIYYYLWSLYLMYYIDVQQGWEMEPHTQTAVNNFLGMHRYDATFQIRVGAWTGDQPRYAYGNVLTWKHLFRNGHYQKSANGAIALADNKGTAWHSGVYGNELSEHVLGAWQIYLHSGDLEFLRGCYEGYFREVFREQVVPFFSNHFEVAETLSAMALLTGHAEDVEHWKKIVPAGPERIRNWFDQRWQANGHEHFFSGPRNGMLMTTGFWHMRSRHFPRRYAAQMVQSWALDHDKGFYGDFFPLAMSRQSMKVFATKVDHSFGYTPDTAYFTLSALFRQRLGDPAWRLTLNHLENYNFRSDWGIPVAPEAITRSGRLFGDQYSNFNAGKLLLYLEGLAGLEYSLPDRRLAVHDTMPASWKWMEIRLPIRMPDTTQTRWPEIRYERSQSPGGIARSIRVKDCPLQTIIEPWSEEMSVIRSEVSPASGGKADDSRDPHDSRYVFDDAQLPTTVRLYLNDRSAGR